MSKDTSSSSGVLFARPTKEWIIPNRPKPGRKAGKPTAAAAAAAAAAASAPSPSASGSSSKATRSSAAAASAASSSALSSSSKAAASASSSSTPATTSTTSNKEAQRAFRERKTEYVASLEARIEAYEKGEVTKNVALQTAARLMKEENERLKLQVGGLENQIEELNRQVAGKQRAELQLSNAQKRMGLLDVQVKKLKTRLAGLLQQQNGRTRIGGGSISEASRPSPFGHSPGSSTSFSGPSPPQLLSMVNSPDHFQQHVQPLHLTLPPYLHHGHDHQNAQPTASTSKLASEDDSAASAAELADKLACGFCEGHQSICMCKMVADEEKREQESRQGVSPMAVDGVEGPAIPAENMMSWTPERSGLAGPANAFATSPSTTTAAAVQAVAATEGIEAAAVKLAFVPPVEAAVPLRRVKREQKRPLLSFGIQEAVPVPTPPSGTEPEGCTGDPRNCPSCKDDTFGQEFCQTLTETIQAHDVGQSMTLPRILSEDANAFKAVTAAVNAAEADFFDSMVDIKCCRNPALCGGTHETCSEVPPVLKSVPSPPAASPGYATSSERQSIAPDAVWRKLKAHPNAKFASLSLLAEVVAKGTTWLSPSSPEDPAATSSSTSPESSGSGGGDAGRKPFQLVPLDALVASGKKRRFQVDPRAVEEALAVLDSHPGHSSKRRRLSDIRDSF